MDDLLKIIQKRQSTRALFQSNRKIPKKDLEKILEASRWAPTAHNMQNFELVLVDDQKILDQIGKIKYKTSITFIKENYKQLSFSVAQLRRKKTGILAFGFPPAWRNPKIKPEDINDEERSSFMEELIQTSSALLFLLYDPSQRAPASEGDFLGHISLGAVMENIWLMANSLGIAVHIVSSLGGDQPAKKVKSILKIPARLKVVFAFRLGYPVEPPQFLRVRRGIKDFVSHNRFGKKF
jgi:nitroreductase